MSYPVGQSLVLAPFVNDILILFGDYVHGIVAMVRASSGE
jgi:hypothetical protein